jgi:energy-coupling factor transporter ATP-binding protein EcfA2
LAAALRRHSLFELHSGAVIDPATGDGVLIIGPSGSGKSTLTVQLAEAGWPFLTDDVLLLSRQRGDVIAWPLRRCFAVTSETVAASNFLRTRASLDYTNAQREDKKQFVPHTIFASEFKASCLVRTLFFSEICGEEQSTVQRLSTADAMARLIRMNPWSCYDRATAADHLSVLSALAKQSAAFQLRAGKDLLDAAVAAGVVGRWTKV